MKLQFSAQLEPKGDTWEVVAMQEGEIEGRGQYIGGDALEASLPAFEKVWVQNLIWSDGWQDHMPDSARAVFEDGVALGNVVGVADSARLETIPDSGKRGIVAAVHLASDAFKEMLLTVKDAGMLEKVGLSINGSTAEQNLEQMTQGGRTLLNIKKIDRIDSIDLVTRPGAGGYFRALLASASQHQPPTQHEENAMIVTTLKRLLEAKGIAYEDGSPLSILASAGIKAAEGNEPSSEMPEGDQKLLESIYTALSSGLDQVAATIMDAVLSAQQPKKEEQPPEGEPVKASAEENDDMQTIDEKLRQVDIKMSEIRAQERINNADGLTPTAKTLLASKLRGRVLTDGEIDREIDDYRKLLASANPDAGKPQNRAGVVDMGLDSFDKAQAALDALFGLKASDGITPFRSLRRAYNFFTGDGERVDGIFRLKASSYTASTFTNAMSNTLNRRLVKDYESKMDLWRPFTYIIPGGFDNFKTQEEVQIGGIGELSTVADDGQYTDVSVAGDNKETWSPFTKGNVMPITRRMIINDDIGAVDRLIKKLARAAHYTLQKFVFKLLIGWNTAINDQTMSDSVVIYHASHGNLQSGALSHANIIALNDLINAQTELSSGVPLDLELAGIVIPKELKETALVAVESQGKPGTANNDVNILQANNMQVIIVDKSYLGDDANNYFGFASPSEYPGVYLGFFQGRETPELISQDQPAAGQVFTYDRLTWKIRFEFGGVVADYRPIAAGIVV